MEKRPLDYAKASMDTMMRKWERPQASARRKIPLSSGSIPVRNVQKL